MRLYLAFYNARRRELDVHGRTMLKQQCEQLLGYLERLPADERLVDAVLKCKDDFEVLLQDIASFA